MKQVLQQTFLPLLLAMALQLATPPAAHAAADASRHRLSAATLQKIQAADAEMKKLPAARGAKDEDADNDDDESVEDIARRVDRDPKLKALLARHGLSSMEFALSLHALLHAGTYLAFEKSLDKAAAAKLYAGYTPEQRANIELLRKTPAGK